jgi:hypothetical protein
MCVTAAGAQTLTLHYQERPPYSATRADGGVEGLVADPASQALQQAGIPFQWTLTPSQRQIALIQSGSGLHCGVGWFKTNERAQRGQFSAMLYQDQALAALARVDTLPATAASAHALLQDRHLRLLVKDGYSYGASFDRLIAQATRAPLRTNVDPPQMSRMLDSGRADWMIVAPEEAAVLARRGLHLVRLSDASDGPARYLYCSADVPAAWMAGIDKALAARPR